MGKDKETVNINLKNEFLETIIRLSGVEIDDKNLVYKIMVVLIVCLGDLK